MQALNKTLLDIISNRPGDSLSANQTMRCVVYTGLMFEPNSGAIKKCPGYLKEQAGVWVCPKGLWLKFLRGTWASDMLPTIIADVQMIVGLDKGGEILRELSTRAAADLFDQQIEEDINSSIGVSSVFDPKERAHINRSMWEQLAFYHRAVSYVELKTGEEKRIKGGDIRPQTCEVIVNINASGHIEKVGAELMLNPALSRLAINACNKGGGYDPFKIDNTIVARRTSATGNKVKLERAKTELASMYSNNPDSLPFDIALDGDVWTEGVRSSITRGLFEAWVDNINAGPMLRISRQAVQQAAARYTRNVSAAQMRYATERDHPAGADVASTAVTPVKIYIDDFFGDPNFYVGLTNTLMAIISGFDIDSNKVDYKEKYLDLGAFDYGKIYHKYEGVVI